MTRIAVNITTRNRCALLPRCLESVTAQSLRDIEIHVLDDASVDDTEDVLRSWQKRDSRIRCYRNQERVGNAVARNRLLRESSAPLIAFLDDDDYWCDPQKLAKQVACLEKINPAEKAVIIASRVARETPKGVQPHPFDIPRNMKTRILRGNGFLFNSTIMTTRRTLQLTRGFDEALKRGVDSEFFRNAIVKHDATVDILPDVTAVFRDFGSRMTTAGSVRDRMDVAHAHLHVLRKYSRHFLRHPQCLAARLFVLIVALIKQHDAG